MGASMHLCIRTACTHGHHWILLAAGDKQDQHCSGWSAAESAGSCCSAPGLARRWTDKAGLCRYAALYVFDIAVVAT